MGRTGGREGEKGRCEGSEGGEEGVKEIGREDWVGAKEGLKREGGWKEGR